MTNELKIGDKVTLPFTYCGKTYGPTEWTVRKVNRCSYAVTACIDSETPTHRLFLLKSTGQISR